MMKLQLSDSDFYSITCPLGDENKGRHHFGSVIANDFESFYSKVCAYVTRANINYPDKLRAHQREPAKVTIVSQNRSPRSGRLL